MEIYLMSVALARHRMITVRPRQDRAPSCVIDAPEPSRGAHNTPENPVERQPFSPPLQRNSR